MKELLKIVKHHTNQKISDINNTVIMHNFIIDICNTSSPETGIQLSRKHFKLMQELREFSNNYIYRHERLSIYQNYAALIIESIYQTLKKVFDKYETIKEIKKQYGDIFPTLSGYFIKWLYKYSQNNDGFSRDNRYKNIAIYDLSCEKDYIQAIIDFISSMTDSFAIEVFNELTSF